MLFFTKAQFEARRALMMQLEVGRADWEPTLRRLLELDPYDGYSLSEMGRQRRRAGDFDGAERYYWAAVEAQPCAGPGYIGLASLYAETNEALSKGLMELGLRKLAMQPETGEALAQAHPEWLTGMETFVSGATPSQKLALMARALHEFSENEPPEVTERLRRHRLLQKIQEAEEVDSSVVDEILEEGPAMVPLLIGVLRGWGSMDLEPEENQVVERALALLGEVGGAEEIPHLVECANRAHGPLLRVVNWAWSRIIGAHPEESRRVMTDLAADGDMDDRIQIAAKLLDHPDLDRGGTIVDRLSAVPRDCTEAEADAFVSILITVTVGLQGKRAVAQARGIVQQHRRMLSTESLRSFEARIAAAASGLMTPVPQEDIDPPTIYEICSGTAEWVDPEVEEDDKDGNSDDDEDRWKAVEPVRGQQLPERNDPCWCGSGKKYKKCHLNADREGGGAGPASIGNQFDPLRQRLAAFMNDILIGADGKRAVHQYWGDDEGKPDNIALVDWMIHDFVLPRQQRTVMQEFLRRHGDTLSRRERDLVGSWSRSYIGLYEVQSVKEGTGFEVKDLLSDQGTLFVHEVSLSKHLIAWDGVMVRLVEGERGQEITGAGMVVPRAHLEPLGEWMQRDRERTGLPWRDYLKRRHPDIRRQPGIIAEEWAQSLRLVNNDGDEILYSKALYETADGDALMQAMRANPELIGDEEDGSGLFQMLSADNTVLVTFRVEGGTLTVECNSRGRLATAKAAVERLPIEGLCHVRDELTTQEEIKREATTGDTPEPAKREVPPEVAEAIEKYLDQHYGAWPDTKLPALGGKTPRQAAKTRAGRKKLAELLKTLENNEQRKRRDGEPSYDVSRLRRTLGVYD